MLHCHARPKNQILGLVTNSCFCFLASSFQLLYSKIFFERQRQRVHIHWLIPEMPKTDGDGLGLTQESGTQSRHSRWWQGPSYRSHHCSLPGYTAAQSWRRGPDLGVKPRSSEAGCRHLNQCFIYQDRSLPLHLCLLIPSIGLFKVYLIFPQCFEFDA